MWIWTFFESIIDIYVKPNMQYILNQQIEHNNGNGVNWKWRNAISKPSYRNDVQLFAIDLPMSWH